jgi:hypothetical protein
LKHCHMWWDGNAQWGVASGVLNRPHRFDVLKAGDGGTHL